MNAWARRRGLILAAAPSALFTSGISFCLAARQAYHGARGRKRSIMLLPGVAPTRH